jgi:hypothetical protein
MISHQPDKESEEPWRSALRSRSKTSTTPRLRKTYRTRRAAVNARDPLGRAGQAQKLLMGR